MEIARSLVLQPDFILLDEPFSGIDPIQVLELQRIIGDLKRKGIGILVTDHNVRETLAVTDRAYIISNGRIFRAGSPDSLGNDPEVRRIYLGENFYFPPAWPVSHLRDSSELIGFSPIRSLQSRC